jgi:hypothetical protein
MAGRSRDIASAYGATVVVPNDVTVLPTFRGLHIGVAGNVAMRMASGDVVTFTNVPVGDFGRQGDKVLATGTTATGIVALY